MLEFLVHLQCQSFIVVYFTKRELKVKEKYVPYDHIQM